MERNRTQRATSASGKELAAPVFKQTNVQAVFEQPGEASGADIPQPRNDPMASLETLRIDIGARLDRLDRRMTCLITGVGTVQRRPGRPHRHGLLPARPLTPTASPGTAPGSPIPRHPRRYNRHHHASGGADRIAGGGNRHR